MSEELDRLNSLPETINKEQMLFGINQGGTFEDIRIEHAKRIREMDLSGYALGDLPWERATRKCTGFWM